MKKEVFVILLADPQEERSTLRSANDLVYDWIGEKHACVNMTRVYPLVGPNIENFTMGQTTLEVCLKKSGQHKKKTCFDNQHIFITFIFDTFNFLKLMTVNLL